MSTRLAIDFGTTNTVVARWNETTSAADIVIFPGLSAEPGDGLPPSIPSLLYVHDGRTGALTAGQAVRAQRLDEQPGNRLFRNFKRGILAARDVEPRLIDDVPWSDLDAGQRFLQELLGRIGEAELSLTAPVSAFEGYLAWLGNTLGVAGENVRIVDESTAAALGYAVTTPGATVLVLDFGGGTLDLSLVQLPEHREKTGGLLGFLRRVNAPSYTARVIAKAGRTIGGSDVDQWLLLDALARVGLTTADLGHEYAALLTHCEQAKIALSTAERAGVTFHAAGREHRVEWTRIELEDLLERHGFYLALRRAVDKILHAAHRRGLFREDVQHVLLVGGTALMPSVQRTLREYFSDAVVRADKPFTAVAEGALQVAAGLGLEDYLVHSYGLRHFDPDKGAQRYDEIIPVGSRFPLPEPVVVTLAAAHAGQTEVEFVVGEIDTDAVVAVQVRYEDGQAVFVAEPSDEAQEIVPVNEIEAGAALARLVPPGEAGVPRLEARFTVDAQRRLRVTVSDLQTHKELLRDVVVAMLR